MTMNDVIGVLLIAGIGYIIYMKAVEKKDALGFLKEGMGKLTNKEDDFLKRG